ncbi:MAG TPA: hypothetical protein VNR60_11705 [Croceibacterium sp.]|nr:hypothetical protein [Croceibacterium sp.]
MKLGNVLAATAAAALASAPAVAQAAAAPSARQGAAVEGENLGGSLLLPLLAALAAGLAIFLLVDDGDDSPASP